MNCTVPRTGEVVDRYRCKKRRAREPLKGRGGELETTKALAVREQKVIESGS